MNALAKFRRPFLFGLALGLLVVLALSLYADLPKLLEALARFRWELIVPVLALTLLNYGLRFVKWHYYLGLIGAGDLPKGRSLLIFLGGLSMVITPGKVGEWLKSYLLKEAKGTPLTVSAPIILAERLTDGMAIVLLALSGLWAYGYGWPALLVASLAMAGVVLLSQQRALALRLLALPLIAGRLHHLQALYESAYLLLRPRSLFLAVGLGLAGWFGECLAFYLVLLGLGLGGGLTLLLQATFVLATATIVGSLSMLPGGLGAAEGSMAGLLLLLPGITAEPTVAAAATLLIRFCTLWFGVSLGIITLALYAGRLRQGPALR